MSTGDLAAADAEVVAPPPSRWRIALGFVISGAAIVGCVTWALAQDAPRFPDEASEWWLLVGAVGVYALASLARGWRWHEILRFAGIRHDPVDAYGLTVVGYMGNNVLPARGGEVLRVLLMAERSSGRRREILGTILTERLLDAIALVVLFMALTLLDVAGSPAGRAPAYLAMLGVAALLASLVVFRRLRARGRFAALSRRLWPVLATLRLLTGRRGLELGVLTAAVWLLEALIFTFVAASLDLDVSVLESTLVVVLASFFALVPSAPGYVGTYDAAVLFALSALDVDRGAAIGAALLFRLVIFAPITVAGVVLVIGRYGGLRQAVRRRAIATGGQTARGSSGADAAPVSGADPR